MADMRLIEVPADGIIRIPIMRGEDTVGERRIDLSYLPTVDAVEVVHGRWNRVEADLGGGIKTHRFACSECGFLKNTLIGNYCPNCGAKMDLEV